MIDWWWLLIVSAIVGGVSFVLGTLAVLRAFSKGIRDPNSPIHKQFIDFMDEQQTLDVEHFASLAEMADRETGCAGRCGHLIASGLRATAAPKSRMRGKVT